MVKSEVFDIRPACVGLDKLCDLYDFVLLICRVEAAIALILRVVGNVEQYKINPGLGPMASCHGCQDQSGDPLFLLTLIRASPRISGGPSHLEGGMMGAICLRRLR